MHQKTVTDLDTNARSLRIAVILLIVACIGLLLLNAVTTTVWDDEADGFFLAQRPVSGIWQLLAANVHQDPPLFYVWLHYWIAVAGYRPWLLRLPSIACFGGVAWGTYATARYLAGQRAGWYALIATALLPYHWLFPAALRWYALFACLAVWNFFVFLQICSVTRSPDPTQARKCLAAYIVTGSLMWYTNYTAPLYFVCHLVVVLLWDRQRLRSVSWLAMAWLVVAMSYAPWLAVFVRQLPRSIVDHGEKWRSVKVVALCLYVLWAGEFSTPFTWWISVPVAVTAVCATLLFAFRSSPGARVLAVALLILMVGLTVSGVLWTKRLLLVSPFMAMWLGITLATAADNDGPRGSSRWVRSLQVVLAGAAIIVITGSLRNLINREGWISYRWIDPIDDVVRRVRQSEPDGLLITNSAPVSFYLHQACGVPLATCDEPVREVLAHETRFPMRVSYIHHSADFYFSSIFERLKRDLWQEGFTVATVEPFLKVSPAFDAYSTHPYPHGPAAQYDMYRLVVVHFEKRPER